MSKDTQQTSGHNRGVIMAAVFIATFMTSVEVTIVTTALPSIISELHGLAYQSWIMSAYLLTTAITTPIYGKLADGLGRRKVFQWGVLVFTLGSFLSGLAPSIFILILARALQGIGAGAVMPLTFTIIADNFDFEARANVLALNNTAWGLSALLGPLLGGFLVDRLSWHWVFFVNVPLGILVLLLVGFGYQEHFKRVANLTIDWIGILWLSLGLVTLLLGIQVLDGQAWVALGLVIVAIVSFSLFVHQEKRFVDPLISPKMFHNRTFTIQIITVTILSGLLIGYQVYFPIWLQSLYQVSATGAGLVVTSSSIMWLVASFFVGWIIQRFVPKKVVLIAVAVLGLAYVTLVFADLNFPVWAFYVIAIFNGLVMGTVISMNTILSQHLVDERMVGSATSVLTLGRSLGQTVMTGVYGAVLTLVIKLNLHGGVTFDAVNNVISSKHPATAASRSLIDPIILSALHTVFLITVVMTLVVWFVNLADPNKKIIE